MMIFEPFFLVFIHCLLHYIRGSQPPGRVPVPGFEAGSGGTQVELRP